jgi:hypothetical protein
MANEGAHSLVDEPKGGLRGEKAHRGVPDGEKPTPFGTLAADREEETNGVAQARRRPALKRLNLNLPATLYEDLSELAENQGKSMTEIVRTGLGLAHLAYTQLGKNRKLLIADNNGNTIREIFIPW